MKVTRYVPHDTRLESILRDESPIQRQQFENSVDVNILSNGIPYHVRVFSNVSVL